VRAGGARPSPFITVYLPSRTKLWCMLQLRGQIHSPPPFLLYPNMYSVGEVKLEKRKKQLIMQLWTFSQIYMHTHKSVTANEALEYENKQNVSAHNLLLLKMHIFVVSAIQHSLLLLTFPILFYSTYKTRKKTKMP
jgi:hypothetical protein